MRIGKGRHTYEWIDNWAKVPDSESARGGWSHHGVVVSETGEIITYHQDEPNVLIFDEDGNLKRSWRTGLLDAHGMTIVKEGDTEYLWLADPGRKRRPAMGYKYPVGVVPSGQVIKTTMDGQVVMRLEVPDIPVYADADYLPTWVAVNEERHGGNGDVWVADGYGESHVHRYDKSGGYIGTINGTEGETGAFSCPHAIIFDTRKSEPELYIADRSNGRVQVYDAEGNFKRAFGSDFLTSPSGFAIDSDRMVIAELRARLTITDINDRLVAYLGANEEVAKVDGWPNNLDEQGQLIRTRLLESGKFNSPHGMAVDGNGNIYVAEWLIGGRHTKLVRV
jgi:DNA-binding beta-propeller fold protein YncE